MLEIVAATDVDAGNLDVTVVTPRVRDVLQLRSPASTAIGDDLALLQDIVRSLNPEFVSLSLMTSFVLPIDACYILWIIKRLYYCLG
jgi:hypothetical protein